MKRTALVLVFTTLAAAAYAQALNFRVLIQTGVTIFFPDEEKPTISMWSPSSDSPARIYLTVSMADAPGRQGNFGFNFELRGDAPFDAGTSSLYFNSARGWVRFWDRRITLFGGKLNDNGVFRTYGGIDEEYMASNDYGLHLRIEELPFHPSLRNLTLGFTLMPAVTGPFSVSNFLEKAHYRFAARYLFPGKVGVLAMFYHNAQTDLYFQNPLISFLAFDILAFRPQGLALLRADFGAYNMQDKDYFNVKAGQVIVYRKGDLELGSRFRQSFLLGGANDSTTGYSPEFFFRLWGSYALNNGTVWPRLEFGYLLHGFRGNPVVTSPGMRTNAYRSLEYRLSLVDPAMLKDSDKVRGFTRDTGYLSVIPQCEFRITGRNTTAFTVGGGPLFDLSAGSEKFNYFVFTNLFIYF